MAERVSETCFQQLRHLSSFFISKTSILVISFKILQIYFLVSDIEIAANNYWLFLVQFFNISSESIFPLHAVI